MAELNTHLGEIDGWNARLIAVSVDPPEEALRFKRDLGLAFELLSDPEREVIIDMDILNPRERGGIARPNFYILAPQREIVFHSQDGIARRATFEAVRAFMERYRKDPSHRVFNDARALATPTLKDTLLSIPRKYF